MTPEATEAALAVAARAIALASFHGVTPQDAARIASHVYGRAPGEPAQECGGVAVSLLAYHHADGSSQRAAERCAAEGDRPSAREAREEAEGAERQSRMATWVATRIGAASLGSLRERSARIAEEAIELAQACRVPRGAIPLAGPPEPGQGGSALAGLVSASLLRWAAAAGVDVRAEEARELGRIEAKPPSHFAARQAAKAAAGIITKVDREC